MSLAGLLDRRHGAPPRHAVVTHNRKHFENVPGLTLISEADHA